MAGSSRPYVLRARAESAQRTRARILEAAREAFFTLPFDELTLPWVARRAGVTTQTVRNHFESKEGLLRAVGRLVHAELVEHRGRAAATDAASAATMLGAEYEKYGPAAARLLAAAERSPVLSELAAQGRRTHQAWLQRTFGPQLPTGPRARERTIAALYAATDVGTWRLLRLDLQHSRRTTVEVMRTLIEGALSST